jgi:hypothetical protein
MRNFLYNKSDILIAIIIIAVAAIIIWTRIGAIMGSSGETGTENPSTASAQEADTPEGAEAADNGTSAPAVADQDAQDAETTPPTDGAVADGAAEGEEAAASDPVIKFTIEEGASSGSVAEDLEAEGIIKAADFIKEIQAQDKEGIIKVGTFKLKASMTAAQIVNKVTRTE